MVTKQGKTQEGTLFEEIYEATSNPTAGTATQNTWISEGIWNIIDTRIALCRKLTRDQANMRHLRHRIKSSLWDYHKNRTEKECDAIESFLTLDPTMMQ